MTKCLELFGIRCLNSDGGTCVSTDDKAVPEIQSRSCICDPIGPNVASKNPIGQIRTQDRSGVRMTKCLEVFGIRCLNSDGGTCVSTDDKAVPEIQSRSCISDPIGPKWLSQNPIGQIRTQHRSGVRMTKCFEVGGIRCVNSDGGTCVSTDGKAVREMPSRPRISDPIGPNIAQKTLQDRSKRKTGQGCA